MHRFPSPWEATSYRDAPVPKPLGGDIVSRCTGSQALGRRHRIEMHRFPSPWEATSYRDAPVPKPLGDGLESSNTTRLRFLEIDHSSLRLRAVIAVTAALVPPPPLSATRRAELLRQRADELGFDAFGIAQLHTSDAVDQHGQQLRRWLDQGFHGGMTWMEDTYERRADPLKSLPDAKSVVAVAVSYYHQDARTDRQLKVARYAQGKDYHRWMKRRIRKLRKYLLELDPECSVYPTVDTSPVLERSWAARAGIAWIGKSTMAIHPQLGTYTFLGTLITNSELEATPHPIPDRCGSCTACLDACPTQAFVEPRVLDARKCIAYWTLEVPEDPPEDAPELHGWVAGCDICQEVCPWNKFARPTSEPRATPHKQLREPDIDLFTDPERHEELEEALRSTALARNGARVIRRNALRNNSPDEN